MAKQNDKHPHRSKPYENKVAERAAAKRAMRAGSNEWVRPEKPPHVAQHSRIDQPSEQIPK
jgi:hypothetical protein